MKRFLSAVVCLALLLTMLPAVAAFSAKAAESTTYTYVQEEPISIAPSDTGTVGAWYNNGSTFVMDAGSANYIEIAQEGNGNTGAIHVYQDNVANNDMGLGVFIGGQAAGTYTLQFDVKGTLGQYMSQPCRIYPYGAIDQVANLSDKLGTLYVSDWTTVTYENIQVSTDFFYLIFLFSKYNWATDMYIDNIRLLNSSGVDVLNGVGKFYTTKTVTADSAVTGQYPVVIDTSKVANGWGGAPGDEWVPYAPTGAYDPAYGFNAWTDSYYCEVVADGYADAGSLHMVISQNTAVVINAGMVSGEQYTIGMWVKGTANSNRVLGLYGNGDPAIIGNPEYCGEVAATTVPADWTYLERTFTANTNSVVLHGNGWGPADIYIDNVTLKNSSGQDLLAGYGDFYVQKEVEEEVEYAPITIAPANPGTNYEWFNHNGFVNNETKTMEIVADGADDVGAVHVYQPDGQTADADMLMGVRIEGAPVGTYTIQYKIKGSDLGNTDVNSNKFFLYGNDSLTNQFRVAAGTKTLSDWTLVSETFTTTSDVFYIYMMVSKYVNGADYYVDNVKLLDTEGNDLLKGAGNFCYEVTEEDTEDVSGTNIYQKSALFTGDSISWGNDRRAWAARIGEKYEMNYVNASVSGASVSTTRIYRMIEQIEANKNGSFDYVIMHGPTNDAWDEVAVGTLSNSFDVASYDISTYAGALEELFYYAREYFPDAQLGYIINFRFSSTMTNGLKDMSAYVEMAKKICCKWSVPYLDLYNNDEVTTALKVGTTVYLPDNIHPNAAGYDILTPYIETWMNDTVATQEAPVLGHSYESVVTPPTATKEGYTTHTCTNCGHSYTDSTVPAVGIGELAISGANLALHNDLSIKLYADANLFIEDAYTAPYVVCEFGYKTMTITDYKIVDGKYVFTCDGISPSQIGDAVNVSLIATLNGEQYQIGYEYGVAAYCYNMLAKTDDSKLKTLLVDLLNYGAAAQEYASYKNSTLCNADLTEEQRSWGTQTVPAVSSVLNTKYATVENAKAKWKGAALYLENNVSIRARFAAESIEGLSVKAIIGENTYVITEFVADAANPGSYFVYFDQINASQMRETVYLTVCEGDTAVSNTVTYSVESYVAAKLNDSNVKLANLVASIIKYGDAAYNLNH